MLIINESILLCKLIQRQIQQNGGYNIIYALDGEKGLQMVEQTDPDIILLDLAIPKINGFEILEALQSRRQKRNIQKLVLTNLSSPEDKERAMNLGCDAYLIKNDITLDDLAHCIRKLIA